MKDFGLALIKEEGKAVRIDAIEDQEDGGFWKYIPPLPEDEWKEKWIELHAEDLAKYLIKNGIQEQEAIRIAKGLI